MAIINQNGVMVTQSAHTWTDDGILPDPTLKRVLGQFIIVRPVEISEKIQTASGSVLYMPDTAKEKAQQLLALGRVIAVGEHAGKRPHVSAVDVGDYVLFPKHAGDQIAINGVKVIVMYDDVPIAVVDPETINLTVNI